MNADITLEIAAAAARFVADHGLDYGQAKRRAAEQLLGSQAQKRRDVMPDNDAIDDALREHFLLFDPGHDARVLRMRQVALAMMQTLSDYSPLLTGAVWKGIVADHVPIHIQTFSDNTKEVGFALLNAGHTYDPIEIAHFKESTEMVEGIGLHWQGEPIMIGLYSFDDLRGAMREKFSSDQLAGRPKRGNVDAVRALLTEFAAK